jgi:hypothetical protein
MIIKLKDVLFDYACERAMVAGGADCIDRWVDRLEHDR